METPTPETNAAIESENADPWDLAADLERRLIIAREALEIARVGMSCVGVPNKEEREVLNDAFDHVCDVLILTAPKP